MAQSIRGFRWIAPLAVVVSVTLQAGVFAQKIDWKAGELASPFPAAQTEKELITQLQQDSLEAKAMACKQLALYGSKDCVPEVAKLLSDPKLSSWSRITLEAIPDPAADAALIDATKNLKGKLLVGTINSIGAKRVEGGIDQLGTLVKNDDVDVACAAAVALGKIGNEECIHALYQAFADAKPAVRSAIAEGGILCAERFLADGNKDGAIKVYDFIRASNDLPKQRILEATRGAIVARGAEGIPMLVEQLKSGDKSFFNLALRIARELPAKEITEAMASELTNAPAERAALIVNAIGQRSGIALPPAVLQAALKGDDRVRMSAVEVVGRLGDASAVPVLLELAADSNEGLSKAAKESLGRLKGTKVDAELSHRLATAKGKGLTTLIELVGERRIEATPALVAAMNGSDEATRSAAISALGATIAPKDLKVLIVAMVDAKNAATKDAVKKALHEAAIRMPDREATARELADAMQRAPKQDQASIVAILGEMGGPKALSTIAAAIETNDDELQNVGTDVLGKWMTADAAPVLLKFATDESNDKRYRDRAFKGYLRIARQLKQLPDEERLAIARQALKIAERPDQRILVLEVLQRCPSAESVRMANALVDDKEVRDKAVQTAIFIGEKIKDKDPLAAKSAGEKALQTSPPKELADRARKLTSP